jgi:hypothetical protein
MRFSGRLRSQLRSSYRVRTRRLAGGDPAYAIVNDRTDNYPHQAPQGRVSPILEIARSSRKPLRPKDPSLADEPFAVRIVGRLPVEDMCHIGQ